MLAERGNVVAEWTEKEWRVRLAGWSDLLRLPTAITLPTSAQLARGCLRARGAGRRTEDASAG